MTNQPEAFSRILIDKELEFSRWDLLDSHQVRFESHARNGRADYLLMDKNGGVLCVLEAKRENLDPYDAKEQANWAFLLQQIKHVLLSHLLMNSIQIIYGRYFRCLMKS